MFIVFVVEIVGERVVDAVGLGVVMFVAGDRMEGG